MEQAIKLLVKKILVICVENNINIDELLPLLKAECEKQTEIEEIKEGYEAEGVKFNMYPYMTN